MGHPLSGVVNARADARMGLYVHVPFCARRCSYCDFSTGTMSAALVERYLAALEIEAESRAAAVADRVFTSVFFGGGTPSALSARHFRRVWATLTERFQVARDAEITLEANPESVRPALLEAWAEAGVNRLSMGAQTFDKDELVRLGRIHSADRPAEAFALARAAGFRRLSLDLMFGFPGHDAARFRATVERALALDPEHLSAYCFIPETGTPLGDAVASGRAALPDAEEQADAYAELTERLARAGLECYETSNFARPGAECRHNLVYWLRRPYLALGPSAHGFVNGVRYGNHYALGTWATALESGVSPNAEEERESEIAIAQETMMLSLRLADGFVPSDHSTAACDATFARYGDAFRRALASGRLEPSGAGARVPPRFRFVADGVIAWIEARAENSRFDSSADGFITSDTCRNLPSLVA